ncbi:MAG: carboxypeptidase-like regulatory domain-containing protein [Gemmatimonadota bacterium]
MKKRAGRTGFIAGLALMLGLIAAPSRAFAQIKVEGEVLDGLTGLPVRGVIVQFPDLSLATLTDSLGYFEFDAVPRGTQILSTYHFGYDNLEAETPIVSGDILVLKLTPHPIPVRGVDVGVRPREEVETRTQGRMTDFIGPEAVEEAAQRTNKLLEVMRSKAPPRLRIHQEGGIGGMKFCIMSTRIRPSIQELRDLGLGCKPVMLILDGVVVYAPPSSAAEAAALAPTLPEDVAWMILNHDPNEIESIRILTGSDAFFRYGQDGRLGAVEIVTKRPFKNR